MVLPFYRMSIIFLKKMVETLFLDRSPSLPPPRKTIQDTFKVQIVNSFFLTLKLLFNFVFNQLFFYPFSFLWKYRIFFFTNVRRYIPTEYFLQNVIFPYRRCRVCLVHIAYCGTVKFEYL